MRREGRPGALADSGRGLTGWRNLRSAVDAYDLLLWFATSRQVASTAATRTSRAAVGLGC
ncbi:hypothetical protein GCM10009562_22030 [Nocardioides aquaticus]